MVAQMSALLSRRGFIVVPDPAHQPKFTSVVSSVTDRLSNASPIPQVASDPLRLSPQLDRGCHQPDVIVA